MAEPLSADDEELLRSVRISYGKHASRIFRSSKTLGAEPPSWLCHYTDAGGLLGILGSRQLWASHALFMNDNTELLLAEPIFKSALDDELPALIEDPGQRSEVIDGYRTAMQAGHADPAMYVTCFSTHDDQLGQWRGYGFAGGGYSIAYRGAMVRDLIGHRPDMDLVKVIYDDGEQRNAVGEVVRSMGRVITNRIAGGKYDPAQTTREGGFALAQLTHALACRFKDKAFAQENEWRLVYRPDLTEGPTIARSFRVAKDRLLPYVAIPTTADGSSTQPALAGLVPQHVRVGPTATPQLAERSLSYLLSDSGLSTVPVLGSAVPLRA